MLNIQNAIISKSTLLILLKLAEKISSPKNHE